MRRATAVPIVLSLITSITSPLLAQGSQRNPPGLPSAAAIRRAVETITEADVRSRIAVLADDSMRGRDTPSPEMEEVAQWIAAEFRRFGLRPGGDSGSFIQRYPIRRMRTDSSSFVMAMGRGAHGHWALGRDAGLLTVFGGEAPAEPVSGSLVLLAGAPDTARPFGDVDVRGAVVLHVGARRLAPALLEQARQAGVRAWVLVTTVPAQAFARQASMSLEPEWVLGAAPAAGAAAGLPLFLVRDSSVLGVLQAAGEDLAQLRTARAVRALPGFTGSFSVQRRVLRSEGAPNTIGVLEGSDPALRDEYVVITAHMDHVGVGRPVDGDSIYNGADDDASGTTGVIELAEAFATLNPRPRRSIIFMTVSGEEHGLWGSQYYAEHPTVPIGNIVANLNLDMIGRNWPDTVSVIGKEHSTLGEVANRVSREHPELNMALVGDLWPRENFYFRSDHYNFARRGVPILFFFNGTHADYHRPSDTVDKINAEKEARIVRMVFYVALEVANADQRPQWNPESRRRIVEAASPDE